MKFDRKMSGSIRSFRSSFARAALKLATMELELREVNNEEMVTKVVAVRDQVLWSCVRLESAANDRHVTKGNQIKLDFLATQARSISASSFDRRTALRLAQKLVGTFDQAHRLITQSTYQ
ncbi:hypothetical protein [Sulfitobacter pacificus]|uniref:hypothetical protein n=1 Tax=Sulfitobacter pacificus TaxID=1499314 RepID=UPI00333F4A8E